jgi:hypothetical protein
MGKRDGWRWRGSPLCPFTTLVGAQLTRLGAGDDALIQVDYINEFRTRSAEAIESADLGAIFSSQDPRTFGCSTRTSTPRASQSLTR